MIQHALHQTAYLDVANYYYKVWETPSIKEDVNDKGKAVRDPSVGHACASHVRQPLNTSSTMSSLLRIITNNLICCTGCSMTPALLKLELH